MSENLGTQGPTDIEFEDDEEQPDETCHNGCERFGVWWHVPGDCPTHLL